ALARLVALPSRLPRTRELRLFDGPVVAGVTERPDAVGEGSHDDERNEDENGTHDDGDERADMADVQVLQDRVQDEGDRERDDRVANGLFEQVSPLSLAVEHSLEERQPSLLRVSNPDAGPDDDGGERLKDVAELERAAQYSVPGQIASNRF